jgi:hypothetical protein
MVLWRLPGKLDMFMESGKNITDHQNNESVPVTREQVLGFEEALKTMPQIDFKDFTKHYFAPGIYTRSLFLPAGTYATGKIHRHQIMNILVFGTMQITMDEGMKTVRGPRIFNSKEGTKKAVHAITDCLLLNVHPTELTDLDEIENEFIAPSFEALENDSRLKLNQENQS